MRDYQPMNLAGMVSSRSIAQELQKVQTYLRNLGPALALVQELKVNPVTQDQAPDLTPDPLKNYFFLPGRTGGQIGFGDKSPSGILVLSSTADTTKGKIYLGSARSNAFDETFNRLGLKTASPAATLHAIGEAPSITSTTFISDTTTPGSWSTDSGAGLPWYTHIDEVAATINTADYVISAAPPDTSQYEGTLGTVPAVGTITMNIHARCASGAQQIDLVLVEGVTTRATLVITLGTVFATYSYTLTPAEYAAIGNFANLRLRFGRGGHGQVSQYTIAAGWVDTPTAGGGGPTAIFQVDAAQAVNNTEFRSSGGTKLISVSAAGKLIIEAGGSMQFIPGAGTNKVPVSDASGNLTLTALTLFQSIFDTTGTPSAGDIIYRNGSNQWARLPIGTAGQVLNVAAGLPAWATISTSEVETIGWYGDGSDGSPTFDGTTNYTTFSNRVGSVYTLTRDVYWDAATINNTVTLKPDGHRIFCKTSLTNNGTIDRTGAAGGNGGNANNVNTLGGTGGTGERDDGGNPLGGSGSGGNGRGGTSINNGTAGQLGTQTTGEGGDGGLGGSGDGGTVGSGGGTAAAVVTSVAKFRTFGVIMNANFLLLVSGGSGGSGGASGGGDGFANRGGGGGGGGAGGGVIAIWAATITNNGTISANGGAGGNGGNNNANGGAGGGGGGGGGGFIYLFYDSLTAGTLQANGGAKGLSGTQLTSGGSDGNAGTAGHIVKYSRLTGLWT